MAFFGNTFFLFFFNRYWSKFDQSRLEEQGCTCKHLQMYHVYIHVHDFQMKLYAKHWWWLLCKHWWWLLCFNVLVQECLLKYFVGNILEPEVIMSSIHQIMQDPSPPAPHPVGVFTAENRDTWASYREKLISLGKNENL